MICMEFKDLVSFWGAAVATFLGAIKLWETYRDRNRLEVHHAWDGRDEEGWTIYLYNLGKKPVSIRYFELFWSRGRFWRKRQFMEELSPGADGFDMTIDPGKNGTLKFAEENNFSREDCDIAGAYLYIRLTIVGRRGKKILQAYKR
jgi:hypothetical protein